MTKKRDKKARLLTMDELRARPCEVDGKPALFHRWVEEDNALLGIDAFFPLDQQMEIRRRFTSGGTIPNGCHVDIVRNTFALVEYGDGTIAKVKPELVRFVGEEGKI